jgi:hypothetical protein
MSQTAGFAAGHSLSDSLLAVCRFRDCDFAIHSTGYQDTQADICGAVKSVLEKEAPD